MMKEGVLEVLDTVSSLDGIGCNVLCMALSLPNTSEDAILALVNRSQTVQGCIVL